MDPVKPELQGLLQGPRYPLVPTHTLPQAGPVESHASLSPSPTRLGSEKVKLQFHRWFSHPHLKAEVNTG